MSETQVGIFDVLEPPANDERGPLLTARTMLALLWEPTTDVDDVAAAHSEGVGAVAVPVADEGFVGGFAVAEHDLSDAGGVVRARGQNAMTRWQNRSTPSISPQPQARRNGEGS